MKALFRLCLLVCMTATLVVPPAFADDSTILSSSTTIHPYEAPTEFPPDDFLLIDAFVIRPISLVTCAVGLASSFAMFPITSITNAQDRVKSELIDKPFQFTFKRPLGDILDEIK